MLFKNAMEFHYRGVLHEILKGPRAGWTVGAVAGFHVRYGGDGARNQDPEKHKRDMQVLEAALARESDPYLIARYTFYLAGVSQRSGRKERALELYEKRSRLGFWERRFSSASWKRVA
jgi:hypothetical protein